MLKKLYELDEGVKNMFVLSASRLMKVSEVRRLCEDIRKNPTLLMALELEAKKRLLDKKQKAAS
jgi:hypothetical protein